MGTIRSGVRQGISGVDLAGVGAALRTGATVDLPTINGQPLDVATSGRLPSPTMRKRTAAATAARVEYATARRHVRWAAEMRAAGWVCTPPPGIAVNPVTPTRKAHTS